MAEDRVAWGGANLVTPGSGCRAAENGSIPVALWELAKSGTLPNFRGGPVTDEAPTGISEGTPWVFT